MKAKRWIIANIILSCLLTAIIGFRIFFPSKPQDITLASSDIAYQYSVNVNTADALHLQMIPGIGAVTADEIIRYRKQSGPFLSEKDLDNVRGIGPATLEKIRPYIKFSD